MSDDEANDSFDTLLASMNIPALKAAPSPPQRSNTPPAATVDSAATASTTAATSSGPPKPAPLPKTASSLHHILVHAKQRGNPLLKAIQSVPWEFADIAADYIVGTATCVLYLSLKYHQLNPDYIHNRLKQLGRSFELRVLLVQVDTKEPHNALKHLTRMCFLADLTLMLAWSPDEAGRIIETYKLFEHRPPDWIQERAEQAPHQKLVSALTVIKPVNKTDAMTLLQNFGSLAQLVRATETQLGQCPGLGPRKATRLWRTFNEPFLGK